MQDESPFASFVPSTPESAKEAGEAKDKKGGKTRKKKAEPAPASVASSTPKKERKKRAAQAPKEMKISLQAALNAMAGLTESDCLAVEKAAAVIADGSRKSRQRIVAALTKLFA
jgi:hypothetical protein